MYIGRTISYPKYVDVNGIIECTDLQNKFRYSLLVPFKDAFNTQDNLVIIMKNPSSANKLSCDMTILKVCNVAHNNGYSGVTVVNLFPIRATTAAELKIFYASPDYDYKMKENLSNVLLLCTDKDVIFAWGSDSIGGKKNYPHYYDNAIKNMVDNVKNVCSTFCFVDRCKCSTKICTADNKCNCTANICYPLHGLRWSSDSMLIKF